MMAKSISSQTCVTMREIRVTEAGGEGTCAQKTDSEGSQASDRGLRDSRCEQGDGKLAVRQPRKLHNA